MSYACVIVVVMDTGNICGISDWVHVYNEQLTCAAMYTYMT